jgi:hypothetical protein
MTFRITLYKIGFFLLFEQSVGSQITNSRLIINSTGATILAKGQKIYYYEIVLSNTLEIV